MKKERVSRSDLRAIAPGTTTVFELPTPQKCASVRSQCSYLNTYEGMHLQVKVKPEVCTIAVTRVIQQHG